MVFTRDDDVLDVFAGAVCDADVHLDGLTVVVHLQQQDERSERVNANISSVNSKHDGQSFVLWLIQEILFFKKGTWNLRQTVVTLCRELFTSLSRLALTCSGLSDMTKSWLVSTEGAAPSLSGANWTFLSISATELLLDRNTAKNEDPQSPSEA